MHLICFFTYQSGSVAIHRGVSQVQPAKLQSGLSLIGIGELVQGSRQPTLLVSCISISKHMNLIDIA